MAENLGPVFSRHGYVLLYIFRRGVGPSTPAGKSAVDLMNESAAACGQSARNVLQMKLLEGREMTDALAGLACLRQLPDVDLNRMALIGHSFGGSLTVLMAERQPSL
jgi:dienelactone hydrolase